MARKHSNMLMSTHETADLLREDDFIDTTQKYKSKPTVLETEDELSEIESQSRSSTPPPTRLKAKKNETQTKPPDIDPPKKNDPDAANDRPSPSKRKPDPAQKEQKVGKATAAGLTEKKANTNSSKPASDSEKKSSSEKRPRPQEPNKPKLEAKGTNLSREKGKEKLASTSKKKPDANNELSKEEKARQKINTKRIALTPKVGVQKVKATDKKESVQNDDRAQKQSGSKLNAQQRGGNPKATKKPAVSKSSRQQQKHSPPIKKQTKPDPDGRTQDDRRMYPTELKQKKSNTPKRPNSMVSIDLLANDKKKKPQEEAKEELQPFGTMYGYKYPKTSQPFYVTPKNDCSDSISTMSESDHSGDEVELQRPKYKKPSQQKPNAKVTKSRLGASDPP